MSVKHTHTHVCMKLKGSSHCVNRIGFPFLFSSQRSLWPSCQFPFSLNSSFCHSSYPCLPLVFPLYPIISFFLSYSMLLLLIHSHVFFFWAFTFFFAACHIDNFVCLLQSMIASTRHVSIYASTRSLLHNITCQMSARTHPIYAQSHIQYVVQKPGLSMNCAHSTGSVLYSRFLYFSWCGQERCKFVSVPWTSIIVNKQINI